MARLTSALLLGAAALGVSAHPSRHGHLHHKAREEQRQVEKRGGDADDWIIATAVIDGVAQTFSWEQSAAAAATTPAAASTPYAASLPKENLAVTTTSSSAAVASTPAASTDASSGSSSSSISSTISDATGIVIDVFTSFTDICSSASKRATKEQIAAVGNVGSSYACNMALTADADVAEQYNSYVKFFGATEDLTCYYWNKISKNGGINGFTLAEESWLSFPLSSGDVYYLVIDDGSYGGASCQPVSAAPATSSVSGAFTYTWVEWTMVDTNGYSCIDASCIVAQDDSQPVNGVEITAEGFDTTSSVDSVTGWFHNGWNSSNPDADGLGVQGKGGLKASANFGFTSLY